MEQKQLTRKEYIESELKKWIEHYEIGFQDEFDLKAMFALQYQFMITSPEHIKTIGDIIHTKNQIMKNLILKPKYSESYSKEIWLINLYFTNLEENKRKLELIKINQSTGKVKVENVSKQFLNDFSDMAQVIVQFVLNDKPSKLLFDKMGIGMGIFDAVSKLIETNGKVALKENGDLVYLN